MSIGFMNTPTKKVRNEMKKSEIIVGNDYACLTSGYGIRTLSTVDLLSQCVRVRVTGPSATSTEINVIRLNEDGTVRLREDGSSVTDEVLVRWIIGTWDEAVSAVQRRQQLFYDKRERERVRDDAMTEVFAALRQHGIEPYGSRRDRSDEFVVRLDANDARKLIDLLVHHDVAEVTV